MLNSEQLIMLFAYGCGYIMGMVTVLLVRKAIR